MSVRDVLAAAHVELRKHALGFPQAVEDHPWGETAIKVKGKVFLFMFLGNWKGEFVLNVTVKLPVSRTHALTMPFASPTGYGLGKSGWVTSKFDGSKDVPVPMLIDWIDESYRAVAPKRVLEELDAAEPTAIPRTKKSQTRKRR